MKPSESHGSSNVGIHKRTGPCGLSPGLPVLPVDIRMRTKTLSSILKLLSTVHPPGWIPTLACPSTHPQTREQYRQMGAVIASPFVCHQGDPFQHPAQVSAISTPSGPRSRSSVQLRFLCEGRCLMSDLVWIPRGKDLLHVLIQQVTASLGVSGNSSGDCHCSISMRERERRTHTCTAWMSDGHISGVLFFRRNVQYPTTECSLRGC